jgi:hypothetical protein
MKRFVLALIVLFALVAPAGATDITQGSAEQVTRNIDVDVAGELIWPDGPEACYSVAIENTPLSATGSNITYWAQIESAVDTTAANSLRYWGSPLFPAPASGAVSHEIVAPSVSDKGAYYPINTQEFYVAANGYNNEVTMRCVPCRVRDPKNGALCLP